MCARVKAGVFYALYRGLSLPASTIRATRQTRKHQTPPLLPVSLPCTGFPRSGHTNYHTNDKSRLNRKSARNSVAPKYSSFAASHSLVFRPGKIQQFRATVGAVFCPVKLQQLGRFVSVGFLSCQVPAVLPGCVRRFPLRPFVAALRNGANGFLSRRSLSLRFFLLRLEKTPLQASVRAYFEAFPCFCSGCPVFGLSSLQPLRLAVSVRAFVFFSEFMPKVEGRRFCQVSGVSSANPLKPLGLARFSCTLKFALFRRRRFEFPQRTRKNAPAKVCKCVSFRALSCVNIRGLSYALLSLTPLPGRCSRVLW